MGTTVALLILAACLACFLAGVEVRARTRRGRFRFNIGPSRPKEDQMVEATLTNEQKVRISASPVTATGSPAALDGSVRFEVGSGDCTIEPIDDLSAFIVSGANPGDSTIVVSADADLGAGVETVSDAVTVHVEGARAVSLGLSIGTPEPK